MICLVLAALLFVLFPCMYEQTDEEIHDHLERDREKAKKEDEKIAAYLEKYPPKL